MSPAAWPDDRIARLRELAPTGLSARKIGAQLGVSRNAVIGYCHRFKITFGVKREKSVAPFRVTASPGDKRHKRRGRKDKFEALPQRQRSLADFADAMEATDLASDQSPCAVSLFDAEPDQCRWPLGDPSDLASFRFCGAPKCNGLPYCARHAVLSYPRLELLRRAG